jgi:NAD(P)-dependent dehydrogenase (short-subunit alcohol dehydrogenase family)
VSCASDRQFFIKVFNMFGGANNFNPDTDIPDLSGKIVLVTGGSSGLGKESVRRFAKHNAKVYLAARNTKKAADAITEIKQSAPNADITNLELDLASFDSVKKAAQKFLANNERLDILMNNGGIMATPPALTPDGYEIQFGTNHLGHALLTRLLMPVLARTAAEPSSDVRIVNVTSNAQELLAPKKGLLLDDVKTDMAGISQFTRYGHSKLANVYFTKGLAKHYPNIKSVAVHPGGVKTGLGDGFGPMFPGLKTVMKVLSKVAFVDVAEGARGQLWASTAKAIDVKSGAVYYPVAKEHVGRPLMNDEKMVDRLWEWTEEEFKKHGL